MEFAHTPVMVKQVLEYLAPRSGNALGVDASQGEGGHSYAFLSAYSDLKLIGIDADSAIQAVAKERLSVFGKRVQFYSGWAQDFFAEYPAQFKRPDFILYDSGVSMFHYVKSGRGFSFRSDEPLDMRIDTSSGLSAADLVARLPEQELADLLYNNAQERYSRRIAKAIVEARKCSAIQTAAMLAELVESAVPASCRQGPIHPATKTFQALRIAVNGELSRLGHLLEGALRVLEPGGRLGIISFHSLSDRVTKDFFREKNKDCICPPESPICKCDGRRTVNILTKKGIAPDADEITQNPAARSARLRVVEKILDEDGQ